MSVASPPPLQLSVILPAHNAAATIANQIGAICQQSCTLEYEVIVVDDASSDRTAAVASEAAAEYAAKVRIVTTVERLGPNGARNIGVRESTGQYLLFCDADDVVAPGWMEALYISLTAADLAGGPLVLLCYRYSWTMEGFEREVIVPV